MSGGYSEVFGGGTIFPSSASYLALSLDADVTLEWPLEASTSALVVASIIDVDPSAAYVITMPSAIQGSTGSATQFSNVGAFTFTVVDATGGGLLSVDPGETWTLYLQDNTTAAGAWGFYANGGGTTPASAAALAGYGLVATGSMLSQSQPTTVSNTTPYALGAANRAALFVWNGGVGLWSLPTATSAGANWFVGIRNSGTGNLTLDTPDSALINGLSTLVLAPGDSATFNTEGTDWYTVGLGQQAVFAFDYTSIDLTGLSGSYVLSGSELNRVAYKFIGVLAGNIEITVPSTTQQYWVDNATTGGSYTLAIGVSGQIPYVTVNRGSRGIYYANGSAVVNADTASISLPIAVADGGTGASTASGARTNLGGTAVGVAVFTAANAAAGRTALSAASSGANSDITSLTALSTPLSIPQGGTGQITASAAFNALSPITTVGDLVLGNGVNSATRLGIGTNGFILTSNGTTASWAANAAPPTPQTIVRSARTSNTILGTADQGTFIDITSGTFSQTFDPAATLASGWFVYVANNGTGVITLDPNSTETIGSVNAAATCVLNPGQGAIVSSDGSNLYFPEQPTGFRNVEYFTSSGTFTPKPGVVRYFCKVKGKGGDGGVSPGGGGGEGGAVEGFLSITSPQTITIGSGVNSIGSLMTALAGNNGISASPGVGGSPGTIPSGGIGWTGQSGGAQVSGISGSGGGSGYGKGGDGGQSGVGGLVTIMW